MQIIYSAIRKKPLEKAIEDGDVYKKENKLGNTYHWYRLGRKVCYETGLKCDMDGLNRWGLPCWKLMKRLGIKR